MSTSPGGISRKCEGKIVPSTLLPSATLIECSMVVTDLQPMVLDTSECHLKTNQEMEYL